MKNYKYDVAFSFLQEDEKTVLEVNDFVSQKLSTFVYSEKQIELAGADGEKVFNDTFQKDARIVVVLYRNGWGKTKWTRIEETAIKNRGFDEGYDFLFVIKLDSGATLSPWIPKTHIWHDYERFKAENAAAIIEHKVTEQGGSAKKETVRDRAERSQRLKVALRERENFLQSDDAVDAALNEMKSIALKVQSIKKEIDSTTDRPFLERCDGYLRISGGFYDTTMYGICDGESPISIMFSNNVRFHDGAQKGKLTVYISRLPSYTSNREEIAIKSAELRFDRDIHGNNGWSDHATGENFVSSDELIEKWMSEFFNALDEHRRK